MGSIYQGVAPAGERNRPRLFVIVRGTSMVLKSRLA